LTVSLEPIGFWSYAHDDDRNNDGRLGKLHAALTKELSVAMGRESPVFIFRDEAVIPLGAKWYDTIQATLDEAICGSSGDRVGGFGGGTAPEACTNTGFL
jgi:hypothetical protein